MYWNLSERKCMTYKLNTNIIFYMRIGKLLSDAYFVKTQFFYVHFWFLLKINWIEFQDINNRISLGDTNVYIFNSNRIISITPSHNVINWFVYHVTWIAWINKFAWMNGILCLLTNREGTREINWTKRINAARKLVMHFEIKKMWSFCAGFLIQLPS